MFPYIICIVVCFPFDSFLLIQQLLQIRRYELHFQFLGGVYALVPHRNAREPLEHLLLHIKNRLLRSEEHTSELQSRFDLVCRLLLEKKKQQYKRNERTEIPK